MSGILRPFVDFHPLAIASETWATPAYGELTLFVCTGHSEAEGS